LIELVTIAAALAGVGLFATAASWRAERGRRAALEREMDALGAELARSREEAAARVHATDQRGRELQELRRKLEKVRRRAHSVREEQAPLAARASELERALVDRGGEIEGVRAELARAELERQRQAEELARLREALARAEQAPAPALGEAAALEEERRRAEEAETEVRRLAARVREVEGEAARYRQRARTHRRLYMVIRGELDVARDRIRALTGRPPRKGPRAPLVAMGEAEEAASDDVSAGSSPEA
jgi:colicin import membrane protein